MNTLSITKMVVTTVVGSGTAKIVSAIIKNNITPERVIDKVTVTSSAIVLGGMAADASRKYTDAKIDEIANWYAETFKKKPASE
jgi:hypothetical protein